MSHFRNAANAMLALLAIVVIGGANVPRPQQINGGILVTGSEFGAVVALASPTRLNSCGATIISPNHILTAAHCVDQRSTADIRIRAGVLDVRDNDNVVERSVSKFVIHPDYISHDIDDPPSGNDLAILVLESALPIGGRIKTLKLPTHQPETGDYALASYGQQDITPSLSDRQYELRTIALTLGDEIKCRLFVHGNEFCAYSDTVALCTGDSGSPLMQNDYVYGILVKSVCRIGEPGTFINVYDYLTWINNTINANPSVIMIK